MTIKLNKSSLPRLLLGLIGLMLYFIGSLYGYIWTDFICIYILIISVFFIYWGRKSYMLIILFSIMGYCNYSIIFSEYLNVISGTMYTMYSGTDVADRGIYILLLFMSTLAAFISFSTYPRENDISAHIFYDIKHSGNTLKLIVLMLNLILLIIAIFMFERPNQIGERGTPTTIYEYSILLFILCFYFGKRYKTCIWTTMLVLLLFAFQNFIYGGRITGLQLLIVAYIMVVEEKINIKKVIPIAALGFFAMSVIGVARGNIMQLDFSLVEIGGKLQDRMFALDTAYSAYHTSLTFLLTEEFTSWSGRISIFIGFLQSIILGNYDTADSNVAQYAFKYYHHSFGGVLPFHFDFYLGWIGVTTISIYVSFFVRKVFALSNYSSGLVKCIAVYFVASTFRWYLYAPIQITRGILLLTFCYYMIIAVLKLMPHKSVCVDEMC